MDSTSSSADPSETIDQVSIFLHRVASLPHRLLALLIPPIRDVIEQTNDNHRWNQVQEQVLTGLSRAGALLGTLALLVAALPPLRDASPTVFAIDGTIFGVFWVVGLSRQLAYSLRGSLLLLGMYILSCTELLHYGFSQDASILFVLVSLLASLLFQLRVGIIVMLINAITLAMVGLPIALGLFTPLAHPVAELSVSTAITTCMIFVAVVGSVEAGFSVLVGHLRESWHSETQARALLQTERDQLEQRVIERTAALAQAHAQAVSARRYEAEQKEFLAVLHQTSLDLFNRRELDDLLQAIVERAAMLLDAPYGELMLHEGDELVVRACTRNQPFLLGNRVHRDEAMVSWQAYDTEQPVLLNDYATWEGRRAIYKDPNLRAVADFPIMAGPRCLGVFAMGRTESNAVFTAEDIQKGLSLAQVVALVLDNATLYTTAMREIAERKQAEYALQQYAEGLRTQNGELDAFAHTVAHDLKNPLTSLIGYSQLLQQSYHMLPPNEIHMLLTSVNTIGRKMNAIVDALLLLSSVRTRQVVSSDMIAMDELIADVEMRLQDHLTAAGATIVKPPTWPTALGYAPWIEEVWANYISNAIKYGGSPPQITLGATPLGTGFIRFWVQDNGAGLSPDQQAQLFTLFTRLEPDLTDGHGIGLSIVERIMTKLGGTVGIQSAPGQGSTFFFTLPDSSPECG